MALGRRRFLEVTIVTAGAAVFPACSDDGELDVAVFPQGVASGDPTPSTVLLWTRAVGEAAETVQVEIALDDAFSSIVASGEAMSSPDGDFTVRYRVEGLDPYTTYYYRFHARGAVSPVGRTKTAPSPDQDVPVRFAFAACQDFIGRYYHAWRALLAEPDVDFVVFLGDYVYESDGDPDFQASDPARTIRLPNGKPVGEDGAFRVASTLADYRSLYQQYRSDPDLQEVHRLFPFVCVWDDHEFGNDCWQDHSTDFDDAEGPEKDTPRREAATRAFFEYQPIDVAYDGAAGYPNDLRIYRSLRFGKHVEIFLTDGRYYRDDHVIPEGPTNGGVGKFEENSSLGARNFLLKTGFDPLEAAAQPTLLGEAQREWLIEGLTGSLSTWKIWAGDLQLAQMAVDLTDFDMLPEEYRGTFYMSCDQWDGYRSERRAILESLTEVENLVCIAGDIHAFYASELQIDFDAPAAPVGVEFVVAGISSLSFQDETIRAIESSDILVAVGLLELVPLLDERLVEAGPHYRFARSQANGIALMVAAAEKLDVTFLIVPDVTSPTASGDIERVALSTVAGSNSITVA